MKLKLKECEFLILWNGSEWVASVDGKTIALGVTCVGAMINAEIAIRKQDRE